MVIFYLLFFFNFLLISFDEALQIDLNNLDAWYNKGNVFKKLLKFTKAIEWYFFI